jgi:hypothetical protein
MMKRIWRENSLSIVSLGLFLLFLGAQAVSGYRVFTEDQQQHGDEHVSFGRYLTTGHFVEATFENWESEFLQMGAYVLLTVSLRQKGSAESKSLDKPEPVDQDPREEADNPRAPGPVRRGGLSLKLYEHSLSLAFCALFLLSFVVHALGGAREFSAEQVAHGGQPVTTLTFLGTSRFWFESFQNWQSEFLAVASIVLLSVYLRERGSPESKPVAAPHDETGE